MPYAPRRSLRASLFACLVGVVLGLAGCAAKDRRPHVFMCPEGWRCEPIDGGAADAAADGIGADGATADGDAGPGLDGASLDGAPGDGPGDDGADGGEELVCIACTTDADCDPGYPCVELPSGGRVCLRICDRDLPDCPPRFDCVESLITPLPHPVCAPIGERCCVDFDEDDHGVGVGCRGLDCDETNRRIHASATEECNGRDDDCDMEVDEGNPGGGLVCSTGMPGVCSSGVTVCRGGLIVCQPDAMGATETCDGRDEDCDSQVDEDEAGFALTRACYDGPAGTAGVGVCVEGVQTCAGGEYRACIGQVLPSEEACDGEDDDCDGMVDDGDPGGGI
ncbi:MAG: putative metal-binding motif-containing protein, partial [Myxococcales bacterium]|nr:putative metal-binding motif-containing protein [Myxococcales bacterium]